MTPVEGTPYELEYSGHTWWVMERGGVVSGPHRTKGAALSAAISKAQVAA